MKVCIAAARSWENYFDHGLDKTIDALLDVRRRNGINARSNLEIMAADHDLYVACVDDK